MQRLQDALQAYRHARATEAGRAQYDPAAFGRRQSNPKKFLDEFDTWDIPAVSRSPLADVSCAETSQAHRRKAQAGFLSAKPTAAKAGSAHHPALAAPEAVAESAAAAQFSSSSHTERRLGSQVVAQGWSDSLDPFAAVEAAMAVEDEPPRFDRPLNLTSAPRPSTTATSAAAAAGKGKHCSWEHVRSRLGAALRGLATVSHGSGAEEAMEWATPVVRPPFSHDVGAQPPVTPPGSPKCAQRRDLDEAREAAFRAEAEWWAAEQRARDAWKKLQMQEALTSDDSDSDLEPMTPSTRSSASLFWGDV